MLLCRSHTITAAASKLMAARGLEEGEGEEKREMKASWVALSLPK